MNLPLNAPCPYRKHLVRSNLHRLCLLLLLGACHSPFSRAFRENHQLQPQDLKKIQFYTSDAVLLRRVDSDQSRKTTEGALDIHAQVDVEEIAIEAGTPGAIVAVHGEYLAVSFTPGDTERVLWFSSVDSPAFGQYALTHVTEYVENPRADQRRGAQFSSGYFIRYGDRDYRLVEPSDFRVYLTFDDDVTLDRRVHRKSPEGWRLGEEPSRSPTAK